MDPLTPNDPLWKLLGEAREVEVRGNFTANVLRAARNTPQDKSWLAGLRAIMRGESSMAWLRPAALAMAVVVLVAGGLAWLPTQALQPQASLAVTTTTPATPALSDEDMALIANDVDLALEGMNHLDILVAMEDTSALTDTEIAFLLY
jgi:hypothetical protein